MSLTPTDRGSGGNTTAATSFTGVSPSGTIAAGSMGVLIITADNAGAGGATAVCPATITDSKGNVWTRRRNPIFDPGAAAAGVEIAVYTSLLTTALLATDNANFNWAAGVSVTAKNFAFKEVSASAGVPTYVTGADGTGATTGTPTITTTSIANGDLVIGFGGSESADTWAGDADTTNGSWSTKVSRAAGTGATGMTLFTQHKVVTAAATQTFNPTLTSADVILAWIQIHETPPTSLTPDPVPAVLAVPGPAVASPFGLSPAPIATPLAVTASVVSRQFTLSPAPIPAAASVPSPAVIVDQSVNPAPIAAPTAVVVPTVDRPLSISPAPIAAPTSVPSPPAQAPLTISPSPVAAVTAVIAPTLARALELSPAPVSATAAVIAPSIGRPLTVAPAPMSVVLLVPAPTIDAPGGSVTVQPAPIAALTSQAAPVVGLLNDLNPAPVPVIVVAPAPALEGVRELAPGPVVAVLTIPPPSVTHAAAGPPPPTGPARVTVDANVSALTVGANATGLRVTTGAAELEIEVK